jgi:L-ascorbate metabolism protein UlaG (beta-lactamase superfamily)
LAFYYLKNAMNEREREGTTMVTTARPPTGAGVSLIPKAGTPDFMQGEVFFIGTATVLIKYAGFTILTDPNFLHRGGKAHAGYGLFTTRLTDPAIELEALPPFDFVLLSHMHDDHFDHEVVKRLDKKTPIVSTKHATDDLRKKGFKDLYALETWQSLTFYKGQASLKITSMPGRHGPGILTMALPPVMGSLLEFSAPGEANKLRVYITGDTLVYEDLREIPRRYPDIDLALLHLGGTRIMGVMLTMDAKQGVEMIKLVLPKVSIPIHYDDYTLFKSPLSDFKKHIDAMGLQEYVRYIERGETYQFTVA